MAKSRPSFSDVIEQEADRFLDKIFTPENDISDFGDFKNAFHNYMATPNGENAHLDEEDVINLFEKAKDRMKENVSKERMEELYGDGTVVQRVPVSENKQVTITFKKIPVPAYTTKTGKHKKAHIRGYSNWTSAQNKFVQVRKAQGKTPKKIFAEYNLHFKSNPKTYSAVKSKSYRM